MATTQSGMKEQNIQGQFSTAEVTHVMKAIHLEGVCYLQNHVAMKLTGVEGPIREYHDNVTRPNIERLVGVASQIGIPLPFVRPLEERENEIKAQLQGQNVAGALTEGEGIAGVLSNAEQMAMFYTVSLNLATDRNVVDVFRRNLQTVIDQKPRIEEAFRNTKEYVAPPVVRQVQLAGAMTKGVAGQQSHGGAGGAGVR